MDSNEAPMPEEEVSAEVLPDETEMIDLAEVETLPAVIGFTPRHDVINHELVERVRGFLSQKCTVKAYSISDYYGNTVKESIQLEVGKVKINIDLITENT